MGKKITKNEVFGVTFLEAYRKKWNPRNKLFGINSIGEAASASRIWIDCFNINFYLL